MLLISRLHWQDFESAERGRVIEMNRSSAVDQNFPSNSRACSWQLPLNQPPPSSSIESLGHKLACASGPMPQRGVVVYWPHCFAVYLDFGANRDGGEKADRYLASLR